MTPQELQTRRALALQEMKRAQQTGLELRLSPDLVPALLVLVERSLRGAPPLKSLPRQRELVTHLAADLDKRAMLAGLSRESLLRGHTMRPVPWRVRADAACFFASHVAVGAGMSSDTLFWIGAGFANVVHSALVTDFPNMAEMLLDSLDPSKNVPVSAEDIAR